MGGVARASQSKDTLIIDLNFRKAGFAAGSNDMTARGHRGKVVASCKGLAPLLVQQGDLLVDFESGSPARLAKRRAEQGRKPFHALIGVTASATGCVLRRHCAGAAAVSRLQAACLT